ncbi:hypothetical protein GGD55_006178 [Rhizobium giardinii]|uniref:Uncharacterized protein n=1 Tax=Rhizobium giardinii TaxID=56731 RepID=A0A7W8UHP5_9HYPH|nr:hypothetical protein [Rhizobium giardinii]
MRERRRRLKAIAGRLAGIVPDRLAGQLAVLINGAFVSTQSSSSARPTGLLRDAAHALIATSRSFLPAGCGRHLRGSSSHLIES